MESLPDTTVAPVFLTDDDTGAAVTHTIAAVADETWVIDWIQCSYAADPSGTPGNLTVTIDGTTVIDQDITQTNPPMLDFSEQGVYGGANEAVVVTLGAVAGVQGFLNVKYH